MIVEVVEFFISIINYMYMVLKLCSFNDFLDDICIFI